MSRRKRQRHVLGPKLPVAAAVAAEPPHDEPRGPIVAVGAPVAERAWCLPQWFDCLAAQTVQPDHFCFVYSDSQDSTYLELQRGVNRMVDVGTGALTIDRCKLPFYSRDQRHENGADPNRADHFSKLRNRLRSMFLKTDADYFLSLDTDILLEDPKTIERMVAVLQTGDWDLACARTALHPLGEMSECYNAAFWRSTDKGDFQRVWERAGGYYASQKSPVKIDIPMACYMIRRWPMAMCAYKPHEQGEDLGFADALDQHGIRCAWLTDLPARHVWGADYLEQAA